MTENAIQKAITDSGDKLCNVALLVATLKLTANDVKKNFPVQGADRIVTGERGDGFAVVLVIGEHATKTPSSIDTVWSSHAYQTRAELEVKERNSTYIELLAKRPAPVIQSENRIRDHLVKTGANSSQIANKEKASAHSFFNETKQEVKQEKKSSISQMFKKAPASKLTKEEPKETLAEVKTEQTSSTKDGKAVKVKRNTTTNDESAESPSTTKGNNENRKSHTESSKQRTVSRFNESVKKEDEDSMDEDVITEQSIKVSSKGRKSSEKRKNGSDDSDGEVAQPKKRLKKRRVAIESDSDQEDELPPEPQPKTKKTKQTSSRDGSSANDSNKQTPKLSIKNSKTSSTKSKVSRTDEDRKNEENIEGAAPQMSKLNQSDRKPQGGKRRRRVLKEVTHTFKDEDGYLQTNITKEMVSETDSESEDNGKATVANKPKSVVKPTLAPKGQASLFAFFKKQ